MKNQALKIAEDTKLPIYAIACALLALFFEYCVIYISSGRLMLLFHSPLQIGRGVSAIDMIESLLVLAIPISMAILILLYAKKNLLLLSLPIMVYILRVLVKTGYLILYEGALTLKETWVDLLVYLLLLLVFGLTVWGKIPSGWWLTAVCGAFIVMEMLKLLVPAIINDAIGMSSIYLSTFLSTVFFFMGYGIIGMAMVRREVLCDGKKEY
ncbi:MAG: hypothetical protein LBV33_02550 [Lachnospiraceae bacterium]|jgi:hypothetical protein|nr:hypothetical protein [Lachnospiraceae bacterium]